MMLFLRMQVFQVVLKGIIKLFSITHANSDLRWSSLLSPNKKKKKSKDYLLLVAVAPVNRKLNRSALVIISNGPIVVHRHQASCEEIKVPGLYH